jgi:aryl-alcohol dehydrogenase-like predicted oxidoreductase
MHVESRFDSFYIHKVFNLSFNRYNFTMNHNRLGMGCWQLGNSLWHNMDADQGVMLVKEAMKLGIQDFDTAPGYGNGRSEIIIGKAIQANPNKVNIISKFGHQANGIENFDPRLLESSINETIGRLRKSPLTTLLLHNPPINVLSGSQNHWSILELIRTKGLIKAYGASIDQLSEGVVLLKQSGVQVVEILFNIFFQHFRSMLKLFKDKNMQIIVKVPLDSGWLSGKYHQNSTFTGIRSRWTKFDIARRGELVQKLKARFPTTSITELALRFLYSYAEIDTIIPGISSIDQLHELVAIPQLPLAVADKQWLESFYDTWIKEDPLPW